MSFIREDTRWVLFLSSNGRPEDRHIQDLAFGLYCLESAGIDKKSISIYIDGPDRHLISQLISTGSLNTHQVHEANDFFAHQAANISKNIVIFVTGHGSIDGIDGSTPISPYKLISCIKDSPNLERAVVYLGQCYAGVFNYVGAGSNHGQGQKNVNVVLMGATSLHESISSSTTENLPAGQMQWLANIFLLHVFKWISTPKDVDGDGKKTIIDSYKYAGVVSNMQNKEIKMGSFVRCVDLHAKYFSAKEECDQNPSDAMLALKMQAYDSQYQQELQIGYIHQECWILNAVPAQSWEI